jgi:hypothetical protein
MSTDTARYLVRSRVHVTHSVVSVALGLVQLAFGLKLLITSNFAGGLLNAALSLGDGPSDLDPNLYQRAVSETASRSATAPLIF